MIDNRSIRSRSAIISAALSSALLISGCHSSPKKPATQPASDVPAGIDPYASGLDSLSNGQTDKATEDLLAAIRKNPDLIMPRQSLAQIYMDKKEYGKAASQYDVLTKLDPYTASNFYYLGYCQQLLNKLPQATASYKQALVLDDKDAKSATNLGVVYLSLNQTDDAIKYLDQATKLDDKSWYAFVSYGIALDTNAQYRDAEQAYRKSLEIDPNQTSTMYNLGGNLIVQGRASEAVPILQELVKREDSARFHKKLADALAASDDFPNATAEYKKALQIDGHYLSAINEYASVLIKQFEKEAEFDDNKKATAIDLWHQSLAINPNQESVKALLKKWSGGK